MNLIPFNVPFITGNEVGNLHNVLDSKHLAGDGQYTKLCSSWLEENLFIKKVLLTQSCTAALEMAAILANIGIGDEIIMPSFTFVSTANAFVLRGGIPVFVDIRGDTKNIDESLIEKAITSKTKAIVVVHYAGVACEMDTIMEIAAKHNLIVIEDAAQAILSSYKGRKLGSIGHLGCLSFHETKNIQCGEGGALLINDEVFLDRAEIIREKGTNRAHFFRGQVDKYTWYDVGSSFLPSEFTAAILYAQLLDSRAITEKKIEIWNTYLDFFASKGFAIGLSHIPNHCEHNAHIFYITLQSQQKRNGLINSLRANGIQSSFHYIPLHSSVAGLKFGKVGSTMHLTDATAECLLRLPVYPNLNIEAVLEGLEMCSENLF